jgi:hypothetical protein
MAAPSGHGAKARPADLLSERVRASITMIQGDQLCRPTTKHEQCGAKNRNSYRTYQPNIAKSGLRPSPRLLMTKLKGKVQVAIRNERAMQRRLADHRAKKADASSRKMTMVRYGQRAKGCRRAR